MLNEAAIDFAIMLRDKLGKRVLGPEYPLIARIKNLYIKNVLIKLEKDEHLITYKKEIISVIDTFKQESTHKSVRIIIDVDPV